MVSLEKSEPIGILIKDPFARELFGIDNQLSFENNDDCKKENIYQVRYRLSLNLGKGTYILLVKIYTKTIRAQFNSMDIIPITFQVTPADDLKFIGFCKLIPEVTFQRIPTAELSSPAKLYQD